MSNGRRARRHLSPNQSAIARLLGPLDGARIPGGCESCEAYQTTAPATAGVRVLTVHHEDLCPVLVAYEAKP